MANHLDINNNINDEIDTLDKAIETAIDRKISIPYQFRGRMQLGATDEYTRNNIVMYSDTINGIHRTQYIHRYQNYTGGADSYVYLLNVSDNNQKNEFIKYINNNAH